MNSVVEEESFQSTSCNNFKKFSSSTSFSEFGERLLLYGIKCFTALKELNPNEGLYQKIEFSNAKILKQQRKK